MKGTSKTKVAPLRHGNNINEEVTWIHKHSSYSSSPWKAGEGLQAKGTTASGGNDNMQQWPRKEGILHPYWRSPIQQSWALSTKHSRNPSTACFYSLTNNLTTQTKSEDHWAALACQYTSQTNTQSLKCLATNNQQHPQNNAENRTQSLLSFTPKHHTKSSNLKTLPFQPQRTNRRIIYPKQNGQNA